MSTPQHELEWELEGESEFETELESEFESEYEMESEYEVESEFEGEGEFELESEWEMEGEFEGEAEDEAFFRRLRRIARGVGGFVRRAAPILRSVARVAAPMVATAVGGPLGGILGSVASRALGEGEAEFEEEFEVESEFEVEGEFEGESMASAPITPSAAVAEYMAEVAARAATEAEAEAMIGAASMGVLSNTDRAALRRLLPHLVRGTAILTRVLRRRSITRPAVRTVPTIMRRTVSVLRRQAASGRPVTRATAARVMATQTRRVLSSPTTCAHIIRRNIQSAATSRRMAPARVRRIRRAQP